MGRSYELGQTRHPVVLAPPGHLGEDTRRRPRIDEGRRPDLDGSGPGEQQLDGIGPRGHAADTDNGSRRKGGVAVVDGAYGDGVDRRP
jgi:hypothetical protein